MAERSEIDSYSRNTGAGKRHILCMKWGTKYGPEYVNRLYAMVRRHLTGDFQFVCLTDDERGVRPEVRCLPIPPLNLHLAPGQRDGAWKKLTTFEADLHGLRGTALFLDLDVVVVGSLDGFFTQQGEFLIIHDYPRFWRFGERIVGNSSVYRFHSTTNFTDHHNTFCLWIIHKKLYSLFGRGADDWIAADTYCRRNSQSCSTYLISCFIGKRS